ncbi:Sodium/calcium exchanger protein-domain-containing protein [Chytridium lagenaria]|nr:Sodium/calcium exchanger protein-domain-containing protein [Chytridium lagenaria]
MYVCSPWRNFLVTGVSLMMLGVYLMNLFVAAGIVAADFFGPGLKTILTRCGLPSSTITAVLLAFGNGSIEVFSAISATRSGQTNLAYGELVSSAFCVTTLMVGMVAVFQPFRFVRRAFLRDTVFFLGVIVISIIILSDDDIKLFEGAGFLIMYIVYMLVVTVGTSWYGHEDTPPILDDEGTGHFNVWEPIPASERNRPIIFPLSIDSFPERGCARRSHVSVQISRGQSKSLWSAYAITEAANFPAPSTVFQATTFEWLFPTLSQTWNRRSLYERILSVLIAPSVIANVPDGVVPSTPTPKPSRPEVLFDGDESMEPSLYPSPERVLTANAAKAAPSVDESMSWFVQGLSVLGGLGVLHFTAKEIIGVLGAFGVVLGWGSVLVVTIFMLGCNLGDILTNRPYLFVSPMLNLLFGIGLSSVYVITLYGGTPVPKILDDDDDNEVAIFTSTSVLIIMYGLLASVAFSAVYVPYKGFKATRLYGWCLMGWCFVMGSAVVLRLDGKWDGTKSLI